MTGDEGEATVLLARLGRGDRVAEARLLELLQSELQRLARAQMARQPADHTLQPTALVHEAWLRLVPRGGSFHDREHFLAFAARAMRSVLVDHARRRAFAPSSDGSMEEPPDPTLALDGRVVDLLALDEALERLARLDGELARTVELLFFGGLGTAEAAAVLGVSQRTVERSWRSARAWLLGSIEGRAPGGGER